MKKLLCLYTILVIVTSVFAQQTPLVSGDFRAATFEDFVAAIEKQTSCHFYYDTRWTDSLSVTLRAERQPLDTVMELVLAGTSLYFARDQERRVFITRDRRILTELPPGFSGTQRGREPLVFDYSLYEKKQQEQARAETKIHYIGRNTGNMSGSATIAGNIRDMKTGEPLVGASIFVAEPLIGVTSDQFGYFALTLPRGRHELRVQSVGMKNTSRQIMLYGDGRLDVELEEDIKPLKEVVVEAEGDAHVMGMQMGRERLDIKTMKQVPLALGETDIMKVVLTLPGVQSAGEGTVGLNVRGGAANQNLILLNDAVVYNPSHLFGFFSAFNPDVLKNVELYKSGIEAHFGGRLSSVLDVQTREGNTKKFSGSGGISPITGRLSVEGPIIKDRTSFIIGARSTYSDWLLRQLDRRELQNSTGSFRDITASISHKIDDNNSLYLSAYSSKDRFTLNSDTAYSYRDENASVKWKHLFNNKLYTVFTGAFSHYAYSMGSDENPINAFSLDFDIRQIQAKADLSFFPDSRHTINAGVSTIRYDLSPGSLRPSSPESMIVADAVRDEQALESAAYISGHLDVTPRLSVYAGLRYSIYSFIGPGQFFSYAEGAPRRPSNITDTTYYAKGNAVTTYHGAEPRFSLRYVLSNTSSLKVSYNRMRQYIQMLSNTASINPTDIWKLSDPHVQPQAGNQLAAGFYQYLKGNTLEASVEAYYKSTDNLTDYKNGAMLLLNHHIETELVSGKGKAYGVELMVKKPTGKLNGWVSYTWSRSLIRTVGAFADETVNDGSWYPSHYDKPHAVNFIGNYKFSRRFNFSLNLIYSTGRPITLPVAKYMVNGAPRIYYSDRNQYRIPDYFRTDVSINIEGNHKVRKLAHSSWTLAVYNLLGRANPYSVYFTTENGKISGYKLSIFARPIPTLTYNFRF